MLETKKDAVFWLTVYILLDAKIKQIWFRRDAFGVNVHYRYQNNLVLISGQDNLVLVFVLQVVFFAFIFVQKSWSYFIAANLAH